MTTGQSQDGGKLSAANEQLLRELTERARTTASPGTVPPKPIGWNVPA